MTRPRRPGRPSLPGQPISSRTPGQSKSSSDLGPNQATARQSGQPFRPPAASSRPQLPAPTRASGPANAAATSQTQVPTGRRSKVAKRSAASSRPQPPASTRASGPANAATTSQTQVSTGRRSKVTKRSSSGVSKRPPGPPDPMAESKARFLAREKAARRAARWRVVRNLFLLAIPLALAAAVYFSPVFAVREGDIEVRGIAGLVTTDQITDLLRPAVGTPLVRVNLGNLDNQLVELPGVKAAAVARQWPTGLVVTVEPRLPAASVKTGAQEWVLLDNEAVQLGIVTAAPEQLPQVDVPLDQSNGRTLRSVLAVLDTLPDALRGRVASIGATTQDTVHFELTSGQQVVWGDSTQAALKAAALDVLLDTPATEYNVSAPTMPFIRPTPTDTDTARSDGPTAEPE